MAFKNNIGSLGKLNLDDLYNTYLSLENKQQLAVVVGALVVVLLLLFVPVSCMNSKLSEKRDAYMNEAKTAAEVFRVLDEYAQLKGRFEKLMKSDVVSGGDPLKTLLYANTDLERIERGRISDKKINPVDGDLLTEVGKEVTIRNVRIDQALKVISKIIQNPELPVNIKKVSMQVDPKNRQTIKLLTFSMTMFQLREQKPEEEGVVDQPKPKSRSLRKTD